jgi:hypothetical protein
MSSSSDGPPGATPNANVQSSTGQSRNRDSRHNKGPRGPPRIRFEGRIEALKGYVYDVTMQRGGTDDFHRTTKEIAEYFARTNDDAGEFRKALDPSVLQFEPLIAPVVPTDRTDIVLMKYWEMDLKEYRKKLNIRTESSEKAYAIILGQCSQAIRDRLEAHPTWNTIDSASDVIKLLKLIRTSLFSGATSRNATHALVEAQDAFISFRQSSRMSNAAYFDKFKALLEVYQHLGGDVGVIHAPSPEFINAADPDDPTDIELNAARAAAKEAYLATRFLAHCDLSRYGALIAEVENSHTRGVDSYPRTLTKAYDMLVNYVNPSRNNTSGADISQGISFFPTG